MSRTASSPARQALEARLALLFTSDAELEAARATLAPVLSVTEGERVALACLKLAGRDLARMGDFVAAAMTDYRDVLAWAESPRQMRLGPTAPAEAQARARREDADEYAAWLANAQA